MNAATLSRLLAGWRGLLSQRQLPKPEEVAEWLRDGALLLDARSDAEHRADTVVGSAHLSCDQLARDMPALEPDPDQDG